MTPQEAQALFKFLHGWLQQESQTTRKVLAAVPNSNLDYCPDAKGMKGLALASHIATSEYAFLDGILKGNFVFDEASTHTSPGEVVNFYDEQVIQGVISKLADLTPEQLAEPLEFYVWKSPRVEFLQWAIVHSVHHRGQLSAYLRSMGGKVPSIYGGSADEPFQMPEQTASA